MRSKPIKIYPSVDELQALFDYRDGQLVWKVAQGRSKIGKVGGHVKADGYRDIKVNKKMYRVHRLIFILLKGYIPIEVDHINGDKSDNRIENLREATRSQNMANATPQKPNSFGYRGVIKRPSGRYGAQIRHMKDHIIIGTYDTAIEAAQAYDREAYLIWGEYATLNFPRSKYGT